MKIRLMRSGLLLILATSFLGCNGNRGSEAVAQAVNTEKNSFYDPQAVSVRKQETKAKVVTMYELPAPLTDRPEQILHRRGYTTSYNSKSKNPNWVAWHLTKSHTNGHHQRKNEVFSEDSDVKAPGQPTTITITRAMTGATCARLATTSGMPKRWPSRFSSLISAPRITD